MTHRQENGKHNAGFVEKHRGTSYLEDLSIDGRITYES